MTFSSSRTLPRQVWLSRGAHRAVGEAVHACSSLGVLVEEMLDEERMSSVLLAQRRKLELDDVQAEEQIFAELAVGDHLLEVLVEAAMMRASTAGGCRRPGRRLFLEHAQERLAR
jgi:hypothetical protein